MTGLRRILPADRKMLLVLAAPVLAIALVLVAGRVGDDSPAARASARSSTTTTTTAAPAAGGDAAVAGASEDAAAVVDDGSTGGSGSSGDTSDVSGTGWTDGYSPSYSEEAQAVLGVDATGETTVPPAETTTTVAGPTTTVPGATTTVPTTTTTIAEPPAAVDEVVVGALLPISAVCFAALALGILARRRRAEAVVR
ncbi:hypothetical protein [Dermatobacter hominis]|uniref:hypothetical protein n=1 Tax=Dermatobacter hominis TaxID=2884263 RepID=UPI001D12A606|nr:hypothetical protein [Dermatobacter hominis]UDY37915.1 hypothetical protein LH044_10305 [Dermatobacter hominis]